MSKYYISQAYKFAEFAHRNQKRSDETTPYFQHCENTYKLATTLKDTSGLNMDNVAMMALLHDTIEDTNVTYEEIEKLFGKTIAKGVLALTKDYSLPKEKLFETYLNNIKNFGKEAAVVKLADRIDNLSCLNPIWDKKRSQQYVTLSKIISEEIGPMCPELNKKLIESINKYSQMIEEYDKNGGFMKYIKVKDGYLFAYDESSGFTTTFKDDKWKLSEITYTALMHETDIKEINHKDAMTLTNNQSPAQLINNLVSVLQMDE